ncbi:MAG: GGDEF domain-containing protein [Myxococcales bacterium]|nr:GGDEF domain-containing protein [Myxococcales bacterium]
MRNRLVIGAIVASIHEICESAVWNGMVAAAEAEGVALTTFVATSQDGVRDLGRHFEMVRDFVMDAGVDGLILSAGYIAEITGTEYIEQFARRFGDMPVVTLSLEIEGMPCVISDNRSGVIEMVHHMVMSHGLARMVFISGPADHPETQGRFEAYKEGLAQHRIPYDEALVCPGHFSEASGRAAVASLLARGIDFDGIIAVDDVTAMGAIEELKAHGLHVPTEVAVAGFDDIAKALVTMPPLSTVRQPLGGIGARAVNELIACVRQPRNTPTKIVLPAQPVYRRSCGCFADYIQNAATPTALGEGSRAEMIERIAQHLAGARTGSDAHAAGADEHAPQDDHVALALRIVEAFEADINDHRFRSTFLEAIDVALFRIEKEPWSIGAMEGVLSELGTHPARLLSDPFRIASAHQLLQLAAMLVQEAGHNMVRLTAIADSDFHQRIRHTCQRIIRSFEMARLLHTLSVDLPELGVETFAIVLFDDPDGPVTADAWRMPQQLEVMLACSGGTQRVVTRDDNVAVASFSCVLDLLHADGYRGHTLFLPLVFKNEMMGFALFVHRASRTSFLFEELRSHISIAMKSALLKQALDEKSLKDELTGLFNRRGFVASCLHAMEHASRAEMPLLVFVADMDNLKQVNEQHGREVGDQLVRGATQVLLRTFRREDIIGRLGGDEFAVLCIMNQPDETAGHIAERFREQLARFNAEGASPVPLAMTCAYNALDASASVSLDDLIRKADMLMMSPRDWFRDIETFHEKDEP